MLYPSSKLQMKGRDVCDSIGHSHAVSFHLFPSVKSIPVLFLVMEMQSPYEVLSTVCRLREIQAGERTSVLQQGRK